MNNFLNGIELAKAIVSGSNMLNNKKNQIDALNVFPVPDGDTGTNMASTIKSTVSELEKIINNQENVTVYEVTKLVAHKMIYEARGNSGVILSQIFKGFSNSCKDKDILSINDLIEAFNGARQKAYKSVFKPVEGTILTVIREVYEGLNKVYSEKQDATIVEFFATVVDLCRKSCDATPNKLKVLREVGVTDSGAEGLYLIFEGMYKSFINEDIEINEEEQNEDITKFISETEVYEDEFGFCTEVLAELYEPNEFDKDAFVKKVQKMANSLVVIVDDNLLKIHGHTLKPGKMIDFCHKQGELLKIKSENMSLQAKQAKQAAEDAKSKQKHNLEQQIDRKLCGIISCNLGNGIIKKMKEIGCDYVVEGGQTFNPSANDLINAINEVNADNVFILPNNSNIILTAKQVKTIIKDKRVFVIETKSQIQGITALINFNEELEPKYNLEAMNECIKTVEYASITKAVRTTKIDDVKITEGDYIGILKGKIKYSYADDKKIIKKLLKHMIDESKEIVTIFYSGDVTQEDLQDVIDYINEKWDIEVEILEGNQPNYQYLIGVE